LNRSSCQACSGNQTNPHGNSNTACIACSSACSTCESNSNGSVCLSCRANTYFSNGECLACSGNEASPAGNTNPSCEACSSNCNTCQYNGAIQWCLTCPANTFLRSGICIACGSSSYNPAGNKNTGCTACPPVCSSCSSDGLRCLSCPSNTYFNGLTCTLCPGNQVNPSGNTNSACSCSANRYLNGTTCISCLSTQKVFNNTCVPLSFVGSQILDS
jgi:hypothetical protein